MVENPVIIYKKLTKSLQINCNKKENNLKFSYISLLKREFQSKSNEIKVHIKLNNFKQNRFTPS